MESNFATNLVWVRETDSSYIPIRNYNPDVKIDEGDKKEISADQKKFESLQSIISIKKK